MTPLFRWLLKSYNKTILQQKQTSNRSPKCPYFHRDATFLSSCISLLQHKVNAALHVTRQALHRREEITRLSFPNDELKTKRLYLSLCKS